MQSRITKFLMSPATVLLFLGLGAWFGYASPEKAVHLKPVGDTYLGLLKLVVLPFITSSIIVSLRGMMQDKHASAFLGRMFLNVIIASVVALIIAGAAGLIFQPGNITDPSDRVAVGRVVGEDPNAYNQDMTMQVQQGETHKNSAVERILEVIPTNVFSALATGNTLQVLVFAILFGFAVSFVPFAESTAFAQALETVYKTCLTLTRWFLLLLPIGTFSMIAVQTASMGLEPLLLMVRFLVVIGAVCAFFTLISFVLISIRSGKNFFVVLGQHSHLLLMAVTTRSTVACIPVIIDVLADRLRFSRPTVELLVPLQSVLLRMGSIIFYVLGVLFVAQLYDRSIAPSDMMVAAVYCLLLGMTTAGMSGIVVVSQLSIVCGYLGLPFEAAFVLLLAVETVTDTIRTLLIVSSISAATAVLSPHEGEVTAGVPEPAKA